MTIMLLREDGGGQNPSWLHILASWAAELLPEAFRSFVPGRTTDGRSTDLRTGVCAHSRALFRMSVRVSKTARKLCFRFAKPFLTLHFMAQRNTQILKST
ncbi:unnamed protein product [Protopolystoma xenopodis]|uniref:Uncharacterized protein n=1 Tax=Protopolystoma xenopodis TaxID=117903 RepID=A0A448XPD7_9PLAT|nr:unnamed protein product [Protopolystoma xenopodis]